MKTGKLLSLSIFLLWCASSGIAQSLNEIESHHTILHNGWGITPVGKSVELGDFPLNMAVSPNGKWLVVTNDGQGTQSLQLIDAGTLSVTDAKSISKLWMGLAWSADSRSVYASGGNDNRIYKFNVLHDKLAVADTIILGEPWPVKISPAGMVVDDAKKLLYVVTKEDNSLYIINLRTRIVNKKIALDGKAYTCVLSPDKKMLYISCWSCNKVIAFNCATGQIEQSFLVGEHPNELCLNKTGTLLYVANANDNTVSVVDLDKKLVVETLVASLYANAPPGATTDGLALSPDNKTLYIANAHGNYLSVFDVSNPGSSRSLGFIPTGWFPSCIRTLGKSILVLNARGFSAKANPKGPNPTRKTQKVNYQMGDLQKPESVQYIGSLYKGSLSAIPVPDEQQLSIYTKAVYHNSPLKPNSEEEADGMKGNPIPFKVGEPSPIKYVFYIIKENRTYDQVMGDEPKGNGDTSLVLFGANITPNQHALAEKFVLLDNFYVDGVVSVDGHDWSTSAYASDYMEKSWPTWYGGRGGDGGSDDERRFLNGKRGFIWDDCKKYGVSYRTYGEFTDHRKARIPSLLNHVCTTFTPWDENTMDTSRCVDWIRDFDSLLAINQVPQLSTLSIPNNHTRGLKVGAPTPYACVADNDLAVGMFVEHLSESRIWNQSVVFILEDDAQNGADHVDAHRSPAFVAGGFVNRGYVDHTQYTTSSMLRTMELILGIPPMSQFDAAAEPMWRCFNNAPDSTGFKAIGSKVDLFEKNTALNEWQRRSEHFDFSAPDLVPDWELNAVLWYGIKGDGVTEPAPRHSAFLAAAKDDDDK